MAGRPTLPALRALLLVPVALLAAACGPSMCDDGSTCFCDASGDCSYVCAGSDCNFYCDGAASCSFDCAQGGCGVMTSDSAHVSLSCAGGGCRVDCAGSSSCDVTSCEGGGCECFEYGEATCASGGIQTYQASPPDPHSPISHGRSPAG